MMESHRKETYRQMSENTKRLAELQNDSHIKHSRHLLWQVSRLCFRVAVLTHQAREGFVFFWLVCNITSSTTLNVMIPPVLGTYFKCYMLFELKYIFFPKAFQWSSISFSIIKKEYALRFLSNNLFLLDMLLIHPLLY